MSDKAWVFNATTYPWFKFKIFIKKFNLIDWVGCTSYYKFLTLSIISIDKKTENLWLN